VLKLWLDLEEEKSLKQRMDFQESQCKKALKLRLDLSEEKSFKQRMDFQQSQCKKALKLWPEL